MKTIQYIKLKPNEILFKEGDPSDSMFLISLGEVSVFRMVAGREAELSRVSQGQLVGELAFFERKPRSASVKAITTVDLLELPYTSLQEQLDQSPDWLKIVVKAVIGKLRDANEKIEELQKHKFIRS